METEQPIFVFSSGHRCGSTLLQRLLNSCPQIMIWGEHDGYLNTFLGGYLQLEDWQRRMADQRQAFVTEGYNNFLANMVPEHQEIHQAAVLHLWALFGAPAAKLDRRVWGFKEVRYGAEVAVFLQRCFPRARFIHLTRHIVDCFISLKHWEEQPDETWHREWTEQSLQLWRTINDSFNTRGNELQKLHTVRFEHMISEPDAFLSSLAAFLELPVSSFDRRAFDTRIHGPGPLGSAVRKKMTPGDLTREERELLLEEDVIAVAERFGYQVSFT